MRSGDNGVVASCPTGPELRWPNWTRLSRRKPSKSSLFKPKLGLMLLLIVTSANLWIWIKRKNLIARLPTTFWRPKSSCQRDMRKERAPCSCSKERSLAFVGRAFVRSGPTKRPTPKVNSCSQLSGNRRLPLLFPRDGHRSKRAFPIRYSQISCPDYLRRAPDVRDQRTAGRKTTSGPSGCRG